MTRLVGKTKERTWTSITPFGIYIRKRNSLLNYFLLRMLRKLIIGTAIYSEMKEAQEKALDMFRNLMKNGKEVPQNLRWQVYSAGVRFGGKEEWAFAWSKYNTSQVPSEKSLWLTSLAESSQTYILQRY